MFKVQPVVVLNQNTWLQSDNERRAWFWIGSQHYPPKLCRVHRGQITFDILLTKQFLKKIAFIWCLCKDPPKFAFCFMSFTPFCSLVRWLYCVWVQRSRAWCGSIAFILQCGSTFKRAKRWSFPVFSFLTIFEDANSFCNFFPKTFPKGNGEISFYVI